MARNINLPDTMWVLPVAGGEWMPWDDFMRLDAKNKLIHGIRFTEDDGHVLEWDADHGWSDYWRKTAGGTTLSRCERSVRILGATT